MAGIAAAVVGLPLFGAWAREADLASLFEFPPPLDVPVDYQPFAWPAFFMVVTLLVAVFAPWLRTPVTATPATRRPGLVAALSAKHWRPVALPWWGTVAVLWTAAWWVLAWTRFAWSEAAQLYTFFPLWLGFIIMLNALTAARTGSCLMLRSPARWLMLFGASAGFWWIFEWLNRFVRNWHYLAVEEFSAGAYAFNATLCFSTVLPAVAAVAEALRSFACCRDRAAEGPVWRWLDRRITGWVLLGGGAAALVLTGVRPELFYPALWLAPLALMLGLQVVRRERRGLAAELATGDWRRAIPWMLAALVCGFFWEMWNWNSLAKWIYTIPYVERWYVFEMPLLGYAGYLPFGLECMLVAEATDKAGGNTR